MTSRFENLSIDCHDPRRLADFWCAVLGYEVLDEREGLVEIGPPLPGVERMRAAPFPPSVTFLTVRERKTGKNRVHLDVCPIDRSHEDELERLLDLGAWHVDVGQSEHVSWVVLADPEGNEFCLLRSLAAGSFEG